MSLDQLLVLVFGVTGIAFTYWFFLMRQTKVVKVDDVVDVVVSGGYSPEVISIPKGKRTRINFKRTDPNRCLEEVVIPDFKIKKVLPLNKRVSVEITPNNEGEYIYSCGMNMYHGKIIVR